MFQPTIRVAANTDPCATENHQPLEAGNVDTWARTRCWRDGSWAAPCASRCAVRSRRGPAIALRAAVTA